MQVKSIAECSKGSILQYEGWSESSRKIVAISTSFDQ